jgi:hypothetical protein
MLHQVLLILLNPSLISEYDSLDLGVWIEILGGSVGTASGFAKISITPTIA